MSRPAIGGRAPGRALCCALAIAVCFTAVEGSAKALSRSSAQRKLPPKKVSKRRQKHSVRPAAQSSQQALDGAPRVIYVTAQRAYLNAGRASGLVQGATVALMRRGRNIANCQIDTVGEHQASCSGKGMRPGDTFALPMTGDWRANNHLTGGSLHANRPSMPSGAELDRRQAAVTSASYPLLEYKNPSGGNAVRRSAATEIGLGHTSWVGARSEDGGFHEESLWVAIRGASLSPSLRLYVDALALRWTGRPSGFRFPTQAATQLYVHQVEVSSREIGQWLAFSAGRIWPVHAPGLGTLDGAQFGWRSPRGELEGGLLAGAIPDPVTLAPGTSRPLVGAYFAAQQSSQSGPLRFAREDVRVSLAHRADLGWRGEVESSALGFFGRDVDLAADARLGAQRDTSLALDAARISLGVHSSSRLHLFAAARYLSTPPLEVPNPGDAFAGNRSFHGDASATWLATSWLSLGANLGYANDLRTSQHRAFAGPELGLPGLLGNRASVLLGYQQEIGDYSGKTAYLQLVASPLDWLRLIERISWFENAYPVDSAAVFEGGLFSSIDCLINGWLSLRGSALGRLSLNSVTATDGSNSRPSGIIVSGSLSGQF